MLQFADLISALDTGTVLQKTRRLEAWRGRDVEIASTIGNIEADNIWLDFVLSDLGYDLSDWSIEVHFDSHRFAEQLLSYSYGDDVVLTATVMSADFDSFTFLTFELQSIHKTGTTFNSRHEARRKAEATKCFVATVCYGGPMADEVVLLRRFRDDVLLRKPAGRMLARFYYRHSPLVATFLAKHSRLRKIVRHSCLGPIVRAIQWSYRSVHTG